MSKSNIIPANQNTCAGVGARERVSFLRTVSTHTDWVRQPHSGRNSHCHKHNADLTHRKSSKMKEGAHSRLHTRVHRYHSTHEEILTEDMLSEMQGLCRPTHEYVANISRGESCERWMGSEISCFLNKHAAGWSWRSVCQLQFFAFPSVKLDLHEEETAIRGWAMADEESGGEAKEGGERDWKRETEKQTAKLDGKERKGKLVKYVYVQSSSRRFPVSAHFARFATSSDPFARPRVPSSPGKPRKDEIGRLIPRDRRRGPGLRLGPAAAPASLSLFLSGFIIVRYLSVHPPTHTHAYVYR